MLLLATPFATSMALWNKNTMFQKNRGNLKNQFRKFDTVFFNHQSAISKGVIISGQQIKEKFSHCRKNFLLQKFRKQKCFEVILKKDYTSFCCPAFTHTSKYMLVLSLFLRGYLAATVSSQSLLFILKATGAIRVAIQLHTKVSFIVKQTCLFRHVTLKFRIKKVKDVFGFPVFLLYWL